MATVMVEKEVKMQEVSCFGFFVSLVPIQQSFFFGIRICTVQYKRIEETEIETKSQMSSVVFPLELRYLRNKLSLLPIRFGM